MVDPNEIVKESTSCRWLRISVFSIGLAAVGAGPVFHYFGFDPHIGWSSMIAGLIFMVSSRFDDVIAIGFGSFKTEFEGRVKQVEDNMSAVRRLAKESTRSALNSVQFAGRMGGFTEPEKLQFLRDTRRLLNDLGVDETEFAEIEEDWHKVVEFDYAHWVLGASRMPEDFSEDLRAQWSELRGGGIANRATSEEVREFLTNADMLTPDREEILQDFEHYEATRQHRREAAWVWHREQR